MPTCPRAITKNVLASLQIAICSWTKICGKRELLPSSIISKPLWSLDKGDFRMSLLWSCCKSLSQSRRRVWLSAARSWWKPSFMTKLHAENRNDICALAIALIQGLSLNTAVAFTHGFGETQWNRMRNSAYSINEVSRVDRILNDIYRNTESSYIRHSYGIWWSWKLVYSPNTLAFLDVIVLYVLHSGKIYRT